MTPAEAHRYETDIDAALDREEFDRAEALAVRYQAAAGRLDAMDDLPRSPGFRAAYLAGQVALAAGRLGLAVDRLMPLLALADRLPDALAGRVRLFAAEALARLKRAGEAQALLDLVPGSLLRQQPLLNLRALRIRLWLGEVQRLGDDLARCKRTLEERGETANLTLLVCEEGRAWEALGETAKARRCWQESERLGRALDTGSIRADVLLQMARQDHFQGHLGSALNRYDLALACAAEGAQTLELHLRRLLVLLDVNQWDQARAVAELLLQDQSPEQFPEELRPLMALIRSLLFGDGAEEENGELQGYQAAHRSDLTEARSRYREALASAHSPERQARLALALGLLACAHGDRADAQAWLLQAEERARSLDMPEVLGRTLRARGEMAAEQDGDDDQARALWEEAAQLAEEQAGQFAHASDAAAYRGERGSVVRHLLRSACRRGDPAGVFRYQELERGRLLLDLLGTAAPRSGRSAFFHSPDLTDLENQIAACDQDLQSLPPLPETRDRQRAALRRREALQQRRDRLLEDFLRDRSRRESAVLPPLPELADLQQALPAGTLYVAPVVVEEELYFLVVSKAEPARVLRGAGPVKQLLDALDGWRGCLAGQLARYRSGLPMGPPERAELDARLERLGRGPLGEVLHRALATACPRPIRLLWVPDGPLHGFPVHAVRHDGRYLIEELEVVWTFSGALVVYQARTRSRMSRWLGPALVVTETPEVLAEAAREGMGVAKSFVRHRILHGSAATREALHDGLARARLVHFACHAYFDSAHPLAARIGLPSTQALGALEWLEEPVRGLPLVTLSACRSAEVRALVGREVFGLVTGLLGGGVRAVLASLWPVADRETLPLMWHFYRARMTADLGTALAQAQRETRAPSDISPLFWAAFALFGDAEALPAPRGVWRWLARWRQRRHMRRFATATASASAK
jgi:hypothetical protein